MPFKTKKSLGQNFLRSNQIVSHIVDSGEVSPEDTVLEIGPGEGVMTEELLKRGCRVIAIEKDERLISHLLSKFANEIDSGKFILIEKDILEFDVSSLTPNYKLIANIPYYITGQIIRMFLEAKNKPRSMTLLIQKEVAERVVAKDGKESLLSISVKIYGEPKYVKTVGRGAFSPQPNVDSAILKINNVSDKRLMGIEEESFFKILRAGFAHKRKKLFSNLCEVVEKNKVIEAFETCQLKENIRAEELSTNKWIELCREIIK